LSSIKYRYVVSKLSDIGLTTLP